MTSFSVNELGVIAVVLGDEVEVQMNNISEWVYKNEGEFETLFNKVLTVLSRGCASRFSPIRANAKWQN